MMKRKIAAIDENGFCFTVGDFPAEYELRENQLDVTDAPDVLGKYYRDGVWTAAEEEPQPTTEEMLAEVLLSAEYTACLLEEQMENA